MDLELISITRQKLIDASYVCICEHCGRPIVNIATVKDLNTNKEYDIGLDCKKTLMDKEIYDKILAEGGLLAESKAKDFKKQSRNAAKFLKFCGYENVDIYYNNKEITIYDRKKNKRFPGSEILGNCIYIENIQYLAKELKLEKFIKEMINIGKFEYSKY